MGFLFSPETKFYINFSAGIPAITPESVRPTKNYPGEVYRHFGWAEMVKALVLSGEIEQVHFCVACSGAVPC